jgi:uncharacterized protein YggE
MYGTVPFAPPSAPLSLEVLGEGTVAAAADRAVIVLGAETEKPELQEAQTENTTIIANVIQSLLNMNIPRENIQTSDYRIEIQYDYVEGKQQFRGYKVTHLLTITTDRVAETGILVDTAVSQGANVINSIRFTTSKQELYENQALAAAVRNARHKAATIATTLGVTIGAVPYRVQELSHTTEPIPYIDAKQMASTATPIQPGQLTIKASVRAWYYYA